MSKIFALMLCALIQMTNYAFAQSGMGTDILRGGWNAITQQSDPFNPKARRVIQISKSDFTFRCGEISMNIGTFRTEGFSFPAEIRYMIDDGAPVTKMGHYSTHLGGSNLITRNRYFSIKLTNEEVNAMKNARELQFAGHFGQMGWTTKWLFLDGFASAYEAMCNS